MDPFRIRPTRLSTWPVRQTLATHAGRRPVTPLDLGARSPDAVRRRARRHLHRQHISGDVADQPVPQVVEPRDVEVDSAGSHRATAGSSGADW
ncbi:MAG: hypothetical protein M0Z62_12640 [Actinomycetota bacterium]|nr:hypothetical protein [Actinomycetota bacterium]